MKGKELIFTLGVALLGTWLLQNLFWSNKETKKQLPGTEFVAPISKNLVEPLNYEVDFDDSQEKIDLSKSKVETENAEYNFSNHGAVIDSITYKNIFTDKSLKLNTLSNLNESQLKSQVFLVALNGIGSTPYYYNLLEKQKLDDSTRLVYQAKTDKVDITKEFIVYDKIFKVDLSLTIKPNQKLLEESNIEPRIFYNSPKLFNIDKQDVTQAIIFTDQNQLIKKPIGSISGKGWISPAIFGTEDRYFVNALVKSDDFVKRAYFELQNKERLISILEGPKIKESKTWKLEFYLGPKKTEALVKVDQRLESVMEYGWLWFVSKPMLYVLNWLYDIIGNYGWAIVILAILIKLLFLPFALKFNPEKLRKKQEEFNKKMKYVEQKYKHDKEALMREKMELIKKHGAFGGLLGMFGQQLFLQLPIFLALRRVLQHNLELYDASFLWIPDLSDFDPYYILPTLFGLGIITSMIGGAKFDPRKVLFQIILVLGITILMSKISAGLLLYMVVGVFAQGVQTYFQKAVK